MNPNDDTIRREIDQAVLDTVRPHIVEGEFQSDKYPTTPRGKVPLSVKDPTAQDLLWEYAQRRRSVDAEFADDLEFALRAAGYVRPHPPLSNLNAANLKAYREACARERQGIDALTDLLTMARFEVEQAFRSLPPHALPTDNGLPMSADHAHAAAVRCWTYLNRMIRRIEG